MSRAASCSSYTHCTQKETKQVKRYCAMSASFSVVLSHSINTHQHQSIHFIHTPSFWTCSPFSQKNKKNLLLAMAHASRLGATGASIVNKLMMRNRGAMNAGAALARSSAPLISRPKMLRLHTTEAFNTISQSIDSQVGRRGACAIGPFKVRTPVLVAQCDGRRGFAKKGAKGKGGKGEEEVRA